MNKVKKNPQKGFTLIELLVVIVIIGILAGILIAVIDPVRQQNKSRNATVKSSIQKVAYGINSARSSTGRLPYEDEISAEVQNMNITAATIDVCEPTGGACAAGTTSSTTEVTFDFPGAALPSTCVAGSPDSESWGAQSNGVPCLYLYTTAAIREGRFRIIAKQWELNPDTDDGNDRTFVFDSGSGIWDCPQSFDPTVFNSPDTFSADANTAGCTRLDQ